MDHDPVNLGRCEHCGILLELDEMSIENVNQQWTCPNGMCSGTLTVKSFGFQVVGGNLIRDRWVCLSGGWTTNKPNGKIVLRPSITVRPPISLPV